VNVAFRGRGAIALALVSLFLVLTTSLAIAAGAETSPASGALGSTIDPVTDPLAAESLPKTGLDREQAEELLQEVFGAELEAPAEFFDDLEVEAFRSDEVAVVDPPGPGAPPGLLSSTLPLRAENEAGEKEVVDLDLEQDGDRLSPENPLVDVGIPAEIEEGISFPEIGIHIDLGSGNLERGASEVGEATAFYPNVRAQTDVAVTAVPTGVETYTQLRSPEAPRQEVFELTLPEDSSLVSTDSGGAKVVAADGKTLLSVPTPWAIDAQGDQVPTELATDGTSITITAEPPADAAFPILVDPVFEVYTISSATSRGAQDWRPWIQQGFNATWGSPSSGMDVIAFGGAATSVGYQGMFNYYVPRYWTDLNAGLTKPTSYIRDMKLFDLNFMEPDETSVPANNRPAYPFMQLSLWDENNEAWVWNNHRYGFEGQWTDNSYVFDMTNPNDNPDVKHGGFAIATFENRNAAYRYVNVKQATVEVTDKDLPSWAYMLNPSGWMNQTSKPIEYSVGDLGLGIYSLRLNQPETSGGTKTITTGANCAGSASCTNCVGSVSYPCPRNLTDASRALSYEPATMAQGENTLSVYGVDPISNVSAAKLVKIKVDHTAPQLALSGNLTEQTSVGTKLPEYTLNYSATDGDDATATAQAPFGTVGSATGQVQRPLGAAVDASGNVWITDITNNRVLEYDKNGTFIRQIGSSDGSSGSAAGQFNSPRGIAIAPNGTVWVADYGNKRLQAFSAQGAFIRQVVRPEGIILEAPYGIAVAKDGSVWVSDIMARKIRHYSETGSYLGTAAGSPTGSTQSLAIDAFGNIWANEYETNKIYELSSTGAAKFSFGGTEGTGNGAFKGPVGIAIAPSGNIFVVDDLNNRIQEFKPDGTFLRTFGAEGSASNQFKEPRLLAVGPENTLYVADATNHRIARWTHADQDPQSGAAKLEIKVDGSVAKTTSPGCGTKNCAISGSWTLNASDYSVGTHKVEVVATDGVGLPTTKTLNIETHGDLAAPGLVLSGTMTEQATTSTTRNKYILKASATDTGTAAEWKSGVVATTIKVDGKLVDSYNAPCASEGCSVTREWTMQSSEYLGPHKVQVTATDGAGRVTTKELSITIDKDVTPPKISTGGEAFFTQPQNWLEQKTYVYSATATDEWASGVVKFVFKIDGAVVKQAENACSGGSCSRTLAGEVNVLTYAGGAHSAELAATDAAGNVAKRNWTINVDPEGHISAGEATDTLEAVEATAPQAIEGLPVDALVNGAVGEEGSNPRLVKDPGEFVSSGTPTPTSISLNPTKGFSVETVGSNEQGATASTSIEVLPVGLSAGAGEPQVTDGSAAVIANSSPTVDTVLRPAYDGLMAFQAIRDASGSETYTWEVRLGDGETLKLIDEKHAGVFWEDGTQAMLITAQSAHDADGKAITTSVSVSNGRLVTLTVQHRVSGVTYPVVAGVGYEGGFQTIYGDGPPPTEQVTPAMLEEGVAYELTVGAPEVVPASEVDGEGATASSSQQERRRKFVRSACGHSFEWWESNAGGEAIAKGELEGDNCGNAFDFVNHPGPAVLWVGSMRGAFFYTPAVKVRHNYAIACAKAIPYPSKIKFYTMKEAYECHYGAKTSDGNGGVHADVGHYLRAQAHWELGQRGKCYGNQPTEECTPPDTCWEWMDRAIELHLWPSGNVDVVKLIPGNPKNNC